ncbi:uncharacterized protein N7479_000745 [Penicillium vulpinum]|nr:uncharacterized protein N7479_000745 [Penicillium vulpinum]KAJ5970827.1 hypothetical protein N7479_000745 [Penicillium vulpinum]
MALDNLRLNHVTIGDWRLLVTRVRSVMAPADIARLGAALYIYPAKDAVGDYNHTRLRDLNAPVICVTAVNSGHSQAKDIPTDLAGNLALCLELAIGTRVILLQNIWTQFPLAVAYTVTVHKSQGTSVTEAVLDLSRQDFSAGLSYVAISRIRSIEGLLFETPFDFERFKPKHHQIFAMRAADHTRRRNQLLTGWSFRLLVPYRCYSQIDAADQ